MQIGGTEIAIPYHAIKTDVERISFHLDNPKDEVRVRYRLRDGRKVQLCHATDIYCKLSDLEKLEPDGHTKPQVRVWNHPLSDQLKKEYTIITQAYAKMLDEGMDLKSFVWEREIARIKNPIKAIRAENLNLVDRFRKYADDAKRAGILGAARHKHIIVVSDKLERFLIIHGISGITAGEFNVDHLLDFREFLYDEYLFIKKYPHLYRDVKPQNLPNDRLSMNTVTSQLKMFQSFFTSLEDRDEIHKSPFRKLGRENRKAVMRTKYDDPFFLRKEEFMRIRETDVPESLQDTKDAFLAECALGCRISDFKAMNMSRIAVSEEGIPYVHYIPKKTADSQEGNSEVQTPIVRFAFDIIMRKGFTFPILKNISGANGYNARIKALLEHCQVDRLVAQYNERTRENDYVPLCQVASSKLARKTHVDIMNKVQVNQYAAGLHKEGSSAVRRYTNLELKDRFALMNAAFGEEPFHVTRELTVIE